jgi:hypothetical protein
MLRSQPLDAGRRIGRTHKGRAAFLALGASAGARQRSAPEKVEPEPSTHPATLASGGHRFQVVPAAFFAHKISVEDHGQERNGKAAGETMSSPVGCLVPKLRPSRPWRPTTKAGRPRQPEVGGQRSWRTGMRVAQRPASSQILCLPGRK